MKVFIKAKQQEEKKGAMRKIKFIYIISCYFPQIDMRNKTKKVCDASSQ